MASLNQTVLTTLVVILGSSLMASAYKAAESSGSAPKPRDVEQIASDQLETPPEEPQKVSKEKAAPDQEGGKTETPSPEKVSVSTKKPVEAVGHPFSWPFIGWEEMRPVGGTTRGSQTVLAAEANANFYRIHERGIDKKERDRRAILALTGDFRVSFDFIETASSAFPYQPPRPYFSWATERAFVIEDRPDFISIQHIMVMEFVDQEGEVQGPFTMKHWRQDWTYQAQERFRYTGPQTWESTSVEDAKGQWSQAVYQVDDSPRYETSGRWDHRGGISTFRSQQFWRPLPRREFSMRDDYNVLGGRHEVTVTPSGWLHTQFNRKIVAKSGRIERILAHELGAVRYERISSPSLDLAATYWETTAPFWAAVREEWQTLFAEESTVRLKKRVDGKPMYAHLFSLAGKLEGEDLDEGEQADIIDDGREVIDSFLEKSGE